MIDSIKQKQFSTTELLASATVAGIAGGAFAHYTPTDGYSGTKMLIEHFDQTYFTKEGTLLVNKLNNELKPFVKNNENKIKNTKQLFEVCAKNGDIRCINILKALKNGRNRIIIWTASAAAAGTGIYLGIKYYLIEKENKT